MRWFLACALLAGVAEAHPLGLRAGNPQCGALEAVVLLGRLGPADDVAAIAAALEADDRASCAHLLLGMGYPGLGDPDCAQLFDLVATFGLPDRAAGQEAEVMVAALAPDAPGVCADLLKALSP